MTNQPLSILDLRDIVEPASVGLWPLSPGAWVLLGVLFLALAVLAWQLGNRRRDNAYRRAAWRKLEELRSIAEISAGPSGVPQPAQGGSGPRPVPAAAVLLRVAEILKRTALAGFPRSEVARLSGPDWVNWLNATGHGVKFTGPAARLLSAATYEVTAPDPGEVRRLIELAGQWIRRHRSADLPHEGSPSSIGK